MPQSYLERTSTTGFVRTGPVDKDDVVSVISQARSLLSEGKLNASMNAYNMQAAMAGGHGSIDGSMRPTSSYLCSHCKVQLFTNIDIYIHEAAAINNNDENNKDRQRSKSKSRQKQNKTEQATNQNQELSDVEVATIIDFKGS